LQKYVVDTVCRNAQREKVSNQHAKGVMHFKEQNQADYLLRQVLD